MLKKREIWQMHQMIQLGIGISRKRKRWRMTTMTMANRIMNNIQKLNVLYKTNREKNMNPGNKLQQEFNKHGKCFNRNSQRC